MSGFCEPCNVLKMASGSMGKSYVFKLNGMFQQGDIQREALAKAGHYIRPPVTDADLKI